MESTHTAASSSHWSRARAGKTTPGPGQKKTRRVRARVDEEERIKKFMYVIYGRGWATEFQKSDKSSTDVTHDPVAARLYALIYIYIYYMCVTCV